MALRRFIRSSAAYISFMACSVVHGEVHGVMYMVIHMVMHSVVHMTNTHDYHIWLHTWQTHHASHNKQ